MKIIQKLKNKASAFIRENMKIEGRWEIICTDPETGKELWRTSGKNLITTAGKTHVADQMSDSGETAMGWMAIGSNAAAPAVGDTALGTELARAAFGSKTHSANVSSYVATFGAGVGTGTVEEIGVLNASSGGTLFNHALTGSKVKGAGESWILTIKVTYA